jgi:hypothetical protein
VMVTMVIMITIVMVTAMVMLLPRVAAGNTEL